MATECFTLPANPLKALAGSILQIKSKFSLIAPKPYGKHSYLHGIKLTTHAISLVRFVDQVEVM